VNRVKYCALMPQRVARAIYHYVRIFLPILDSEYFSREVARALETRILVAVDWTEIPKAGLIDSIVTMLRRESRNVRQLMLRPLNLAFYRVCYHRAIFSVLVDVPCGPGFIYGEPRLPREPLGPVI
jgi:hypothetical protein